MGHGVQGVSMIGDRAIGASYQCDRGNRGKVLVC